MNIRFYFIILSVGVNIMKRRLPNTMFYIETNDFNFISTPTEVDMEVGDRFVTCTTRNGSGQDQTIKGIKTFDDGVCTDLIKIKDTTNNLLLVEHNIVDLTKPINDPYLQEEYTINNQIKFGKTCNISYEDKKSHSNNTDVYTMEMLCGDKDLNSPKQFSSICIDSTPSLHTYYQTMTTHTSKGKGSYTSESDNKEFKARISTQYWGQYTSSLTQYTKEFAQCAMEVLFDRDIKSYIRMSTGRLDTDKYLSIYGERNINIQCENFLTLNSPKVHINSEESGLINVKTIHGDYDIASKFYPGALYLANPYINTNNAQEDIGSIRICIIYKGSNWSRIYALAHRMDLYRGIHLNIGATFNKVFVTSQGSFSINEEPSSYIDSFEVHVDCIFHNHCALYNSSLMEAPLQAYERIDMKDLENRSVVLLTSQVFGLPGSLTYDSSRGYYYAHINNSFNRYDPRELNVNLFVISFGVPLP